MAPRSPGTDGSRPPRTTGKSGYMTATFGWSFLRYRQPSGNRPRGVAFSPDGRVLAVGYYDAAVIDLFDSRNLSRLQGPDLADLR